ncbi:aminotransferase class I/II-fold pyridoxal phosphate-dependent enzyme [Pedobacter sp. BMA]|uniref:aminotransferase class I/II-fold pyridoxal phosphate-dependent enzyme n=1 Tax=Pedobacter sp. BMA TaxID=1663685 RepID=UPI0006494285|nr:aminotransferase class I/II-fold pyridoxal phosphate-dependent enzyme [Pedobacter sp. BMA]KLT64576.1 aminotransferase class I/II [Pedobacter sp. BMA]
MSYDFTSIDQPFSNQIELDGKTYLYFGGTAYLGLPKNRDFIELYVEGVKRYGLNNGTSRNNNIQLGIYDEAEQVAADRFGSENALIISSGYLAAQLAIQTLSSYGKVRYSPVSHPALWLNTALDFSAATFADWKDETVELINHSDESNWVLISNSMNNLFPEIFNFEFISLIDVKKKLILIVDDSHGIGINNNGLGAIAKIPSRINTEVVVVASMAKALGVDAGIVLGSRFIISKLKESPIFSGASPPSAAGMYAFVHASEIYIDALQKLRSNRDQFKRQISTGWQYETEFPVFLVNSPGIDRELLKENILISSFPYPYKNSPTLNRIVLSSWHTDENIDQLLAVLAKK